MPAGWSDRGGVTADFSQRRWSKRGLLNPIRRPFCGTIWFGALVEVKSRGKKRALLRCRRSWNCRKKRWVLLFVFKRPMNWVCAVTKFTPCLYKKTSLEIGKAFPNLCPFELRMLRVTGTGCMTWRNWAMLCYHRRNLKKLSGPSTMCWILVHSVVYPEANCCTSWIIGCWWA